MLLLRRTPAFAPQSRSAIAMLDRMSASCLAAFSCWRKLRAAYSGGAIRIRRASDNAETDVGFGSDGFINQATITSHCSGTTGFVKTFYDQSGNGRDVAQAGTSAQPQIYGSGAVLLLGARPGMSFDGSNDTLTRGDACGLTGDPAITMAQTMSVSAGAGTWSMNVGSTGGGRVYGSYLTGGSLLTNDGGGYEVYAPAPAIASPSAWIIQKPINLHAGNYSCFQNQPVQGLARGSTNVVTGSSMTNQNTSLGSNGVGGQFTAMKLNFFALWNAVIDAGDRAVVMDEMLLHIAA